MLLSHKHHFIFIHIYKNAGSSIKKALLPYCLNRYQILCYKVSRKSGIKKLNPLPYSPHIRASGLAKKIGYNTFNSYFSFAIVRNPWDWNVSLYTYMLQEPAHRQHEYTKKFKGFDEYIRARCSGTNLHQKDFIYSESGEKLVDYIARFENLEEEFEKICSVIGIKATLPHINSSNTKHYKEFYTDETREIVYNSYKRDIELFGYQF